MEGVQCALSGLSYVRCPPSFRTLADSDRNGLFGIQRRTPGKTPEKHGLLFSLHTPVNPPKALLSGSRLSDTPAGC